MTASIGQLNVGVSLDLAPMEKDAKKLRAELKKLDRETEKLNARRGGFGSSGFGGGFASGRGGSSRTGGGSAMNPFAGPGAGQLIRSFGGQAIGRSLTGGGVLAGAGPAGGVAAGVALVFTLQKAVANFAKESGKLDDATISVSRYGDALGEVGKKVKDTAMGFAVEGLGIFTQLGDFIGSGFSRDKMFSANESDRAALTAEQRTARLVALNGGGTTQEAIARRQEIADRIQTFSRDRRFASLSPDEQATMLRGEIKVLKVQEDKARVARKFIDAESTRLKVLEKEAELEDLLKKQREEREKREQEIDAGRLARVGERRAKEMEDQRESIKTLNEVFAAAEKEAAQVGVERIRGLMQKMENPFSASGVTGFGSATATAGQFQQEGNRLLAEQLRVLKRSEELLEDIIARN